jgi:Rieske Fe-S protein
VNESDRRGFLRRSGLALGGLAVASLDLACVASSAPRMKAEVSGSRIMFDTALPELANPGDAVSLESPFLEFPVLLIHLPDGTFSAVSSQCTHLGCEVRKERTLLRCPCHESAFDFNGNVLNGPARIPLRYYPVRLTGTIAEIPI